MRATVLGVSSVFIRVPQHGPIHNSRWALSAVRDRSAAMYLVWHLRLFLYIRGSRRRVGKLWSGRCLPICNLRYHFAALVWGKCTVLAPWGADLNASRSSKYRSNGRTAYTYLPYLPVQYVHHNRTRSYTIGAVVSMFAAQRERLDHGILYYLLRSQPVVRAGTRRNIPRQASQDARTAKFTSAQICTARQNCSEKPWM